jgi:hypothetical protein
MTDIVRIPFSGGDVLARTQKTLHVDCEAHRVRADYVNPDVIGVLSDAAEGLTP